MRVITWNFGGVAFKSSSARCWAQLLAWNPDVALVQEAYPPQDVRDDLWTFTPYGGIPDRGTIVYAKAGLTPVPHVGRFRAAIEGQATLAEATFGGEALLFASIHAIADPVEPGLVEGIDATGVSSWGGSLLRPLDLILNDLSPITKGRRFVVGGDFNASVRFDDFYRTGSQGSAFTKWFLKAKDAKWRAAHPKFHVGEERTLFRGGSEGPYQIDHFFTDDRTWDALTRCDVIDVPFLREFSDHAPLVLEW